MSLKNIFVLAALFWLLVVVALAHLLVSSAVASEPPARKINFNPDWRFLQMNAPGAESPGFNASARLVTLPRAANNP